MKSALGLALAAASTVLALPAAAPAATFVGFPDTFSCNNDGSIAGATAEAAAVDQSASGLHPLRIGQVIACSGVKGKEYRADIASCDLRTFFVHDTNTNTYGFCSSLKGIPAAALVGFPEALPCVNGADVTAAQAQAASAALYASGTGPLYGGRSVTCNDVSGSEYMASIDSCDVKIVFTYNYDSDSYSYCEAIIGEPKYIGFPDELACGATTPLTASKLESDTLSTALSNPSPPSYGNQTCNGVTGHAVGNYYDDCDFGINTVHDQFTNTFGFCGTFVAGPGRKA